jgi:hypothetical protein
MPSISIKAFSGLRPILDPTLLGPGDATEAINARLVSGALAPLRSSTILKALTKVAPATLFRYGNSALETEHWLEFLADTDVMRSPIANDQYGRLYWADGATPKYAPSSLILSGGSYPGGSYNLGVPAPATAPSITSSTPPPNAAQTETRVYVYTYVSAYGEEGPPTAASGAVTLDPSASATVSVPSVGPGGSYNIATKRIYRSSTVGFAAEFQFVAEIPVATTSYVDTKGQAELGEVLPSAEWVPPPAGLRGLKALANGAAIGFVDNTVHLSEPNLPHAWPHQYPIDSQIVGIGVFRQSAAVLTNGKPYLMSGADPQAMGPEKMELEQACVSKGSIVETGDGVMYASPDGLVSIGSGGIEIVTSKLLTREQWQAYNPSSIRGFTHDNRYHALYTTAGGQRGMIVFDFSGQGAAMTRSDVSAATAITAGYSDPRTDTLYFAQAGNIVRFNAGTPLAYTWRSKVFRLPKPACMSCGQVIAAAYPVTMKVFADGALRSTREVASQDAFRLPSGYLARDYSIELTGSAEVTFAGIATSMGELAAE